MLNWYTVRDCAVLVLSVVCVLHHKRVFMLHCLQLRDQPSPTDTDKEAALISGYNDITNTTEVQPVQVK